MSFSTSPSPAGSALSPTSPPAPPSPPPAATPPPTGSTLSPTSPPVPPSAPPHATPPPTAAPFLPTAPPPAAASPPSTTPPPAASPPPVIPSVPPAPNSTAPPPATPPTLPPPSSSPPAPATPSVLPATPPASPPPPSQPTPSTPPPPLPVTPSIPLSPPPPPKILPPPPPLPPPPSSSDGVSSTAVAGIVAGSVIALALLAIIGFCYCRKKRRMGPEPPFDYSGAVPPSGDNLQGVQSLNWQQNDPPQAHNIIDVPPKRYPPPFTYRPPHPAAAPFASHPPPTHPGVVSSSEDSSGSQIPLPPPPPPDTVLGFRKSTFTIEELSIATNGFSEANLLGQGGFGHVYKGTLLDGKDVAIKKLKPDSGQGEREFRAEVEIISRVHHRHLVSLVGYCISGSQRLLVYEYVPNGTLDFHLHGKSRAPMDWPTRLRIALGAAKGLAYLHEDCIPKIIHRDIKASNILLDFNFEAKVADFGLAKLTTDSSTHVSTRVMGTFGYLAPEYANSGKLTDRSDVFSFGVVLLELITGKKPIDSEETRMHDSLIDWARPLLTRAMEDASYDALIDPRLENYNPREMVQMIACAAACIRHSARIRPKMSQIVRALEGHISFEDLNQGVTPGHSSVYSSQSGSDYDSTKYLEEMRRHRQLALASRDYPSTEYSAPTSEYGLNVSITSSEGPQSREMESETMNVKQGNNSS